MNTAGVLTRVKNTFGDSNSVVLTDAMIVDWINEGQVEIAKETGYKQTTTTVASASSFRGGYSSITDAIVYKDLTYRTSEGDTTLLLTTEDAIERMALINTPDGEPEYYYTNGETIFLFPEPLSTDTNDVLIDYIKLPTDLADANATLDLPAKWHNDLCNFIIMRCHERNENWKAAERYENLFKSSMGPRKFEGNSDDSYRQVQPDTGDIGYSPFGDYDY